ncbi:hypothetical protein AGMMS49942_21020 [Spirochaetia bacterium]|nr:hypothetical protein AGMMS49942_21020 [Spirochaetia bacterium]
MQLNKKQMAAAVLLLLPLVFAAAREVEIHVRDADVGVPLEGALIRSWDGEEYAAGSTGVALITVPDDRPVSVTVAYPGYEGLRLAIPPTGDSFVAELHLRLVMENTELVVEAGTIADTAGRDRGRAVAIGGEDLSRTAETGLIEDVMSAVKLLPGVGYTGFFDAMPSIRGGEPGDLMAVLDGFYIENPYHWDGGFSIFDPRMIESARLSHGVFSARYGHTLSGLLELSSKRPASDGIETEFGLSTNAADFNLSIPLGSRQRGGVMVMGKVTWWQPFIELAHLFMPISRNVKEAPWIASGAVSANYRFNPALEWTLNGYFGGDGIGFQYENEVDEPLVTGTTSMSHFFDNKIGFFNTGVTLNPLSTMLLKASLGAGLNETNAHIEMKDRLSVRAVPLREDAYHHRTDRTIHAQGRVDFDWDLSTVLPGFLFAAGAHERYSRWSLDREDSDPAAARASPTAADSAMSVRNDGFFTSAYSLMEYLTPGRRFGAELGLRIDHLALVGGGEDDFSPPTLPAFSPRLTLDFNVMKHRGVLDSLDVTLGTGLFAAADTALHYLTKRQVPADFTLKPSQSWTSLAGVGADLSGGFRASIEGYFKLLSDRGYINDTETAYHFDGEGRIWGFDLLLQKTESRYWDGWISYSFNDARYRDPQQPDSAGWYYPNFHRFHTLNLSLNIKPLPQFHITTHLGFTSGKLARTIQSVTTTVVDGVTLYVPVYTDEPERTSFSLPLDIKFSWYPFKSGSRVRTEVYLGVENILGPLLPSVKTIVINPYTGAEETAGGMAVMRELAIPLPSLGVKWRF